MNDSGTAQIMSRLADGEFFDRELELERLCHLARNRTRAVNALLLGAPRVGKTELLRKSFDRLFNDSAEIAPVYYSLKPYCLDAEKFARDYLAQFLAQFVAFRRHDARVIATADEPLAVIAQAAPSEDYLWVRGMTDAFTRAVAAGDTTLMIRCALGAPLVAAANTQRRPFMMVDNFHLLADASDLRAEFVRAISMEGASGSLASSYVLCGLRRVMTELMPPDEALYGRLELIRIEEMREEPLEQMIRATAHTLGVEISDSTTELMIQQLHRDLFYTRAMLDGAASRGASLKTFMEFERVYTEEVLNGRIAHYLSAILRDIATDAKAQRAALDALALITEANAPVPIDAVLDRIAEQTADATGLLERLHARELLDISYGFVSASADAVLADYARSKFRIEIAGIRRPIAGEELLSEKLKHSYRLMMSRYNRATESQLVSLLTRFDFQNVPASLFDLSLFDRLYRGMSRLQIRRALEDESERTRLPQMVIVNDHGSGELPGITWRLFTASGFEGGIYSEGNETTWLIALINSKEPLDVETLNRIDQRLESATRTGRDQSQQTARVVRWYVSKEGVSAVAAEHLANLQAYVSTYAQLDLIQDYLTKLASDETTRPASEFELVIPIDDEAELIAARTVEQIARAANFDQESINQIKTALIEACINAAEHSDSPDRRIYQRFALDDDRLIITVSNKGKTFGSTTSQSSPLIGAGLVPGSRGRGLQIIRALMDEVHFERADDGTSIVMTKYFKRPDNP
jgi:serine/threonine-protein kinase RsbW